MPLDQKARCRAGHLEHSVDETEESVTRGRDAAALGSNALPYIWFCPDA